MLISPPNGQACGTCLVQNLNQILNNSIETCQKCLSPMPVGVKWCAVGVLLKIERFEKKDKSNLTTIVIWSRACLSDFDCRGTILTLHYRTNDICCLRSNVISILFQSAFYRGEGKWLWLETGMGKQVIFGSISAAAACTRRFPTQSALNTSNTSISGCSRGDRFCWHSKQYRNRDGEGTCHPPRAVVISGNCINSKQRELFLKRKRSFNDAVFKLKLASFIATSNQWKSWCRARILCFNK